MRKAGHLVGALALALASAATATAQEVTQAQQVSQAPEVSEPPRPRPLVISSLRGGQVPFARIRPDGSIRPVARIEGPTETEPGPSAAELPALLGPEPDATYAAVPGIGTPDITTATAEAERPDGRPTPATATGSAPSSDEDTAEAPEEEEVVVVPRPRPPGGGQAALTARRAAEIAAQQASNDGTTTPGPVGRGAMVEDGLPLDRMTLLGVFGTQQDRRALVRLPTGDVIRVRRGTDVDGWRVLAIARDSIQLASGDGSVLRLEVP